MHLGAEEEDSMLKGLKGQSAHPAEEAGRGAQ